MEVLIAIGILSVGLIAVASVFPVAVIQQKRAIDESMGVVVGNNVLASLQAIGTNGVLAYPTTAFFTPVVVDQTTIYVEPDMRPTSNANPRRYNFQFMYRRPTANGPVEVAIFVYRRDADLTTDTSYPADTLVEPEEDTIRIYGPNGLYTNPGGLVSDAGVVSGEPSRNQLILGTVGVDGDGASYVMRIVGNGNVGNAPPVTLNAVYGLYDDRTGDSGDNLGIVHAVAIITGTIR